MFHFYFTGELHRNNVRKSAHLVNAQALTHEQLSERTRGNLRRPQMEV